MAIARSIRWGARIDGDVYGKGDAPWDSASWDTFENNAGGRVDILHFGQPSPWKQAFAADPFNRCLSRRATPLCSMSTDDENLAGIASGARDAEWTAWAQAAGKWNHRLILRLNWEMNGTWYAWAKQPAADYVAAWQRIYGIIKKYAPLVEMVWCPNVIYPGSQPISNRWPGDGYVDRLGMDGYNWGTNPLKSDVWRSFRDTFTPTYQALTSLSAKPITICETASTEFGGSKPDWISSMFGTLRTGLVQVGSVVWFNWNIQQGSGRLDWPIESSLASQAAFAKGIASL